MLKTLALLVIIELAQVRGYQNSGVDGSAQQQQSMLETCLNEGAQEQQWTTYSDFASQRPAR
jgi:hypothetical protein